MFLLNQMLTRFRVFSHRALHPIMFLLNRCQLAFVRTRLLIFTSHYVPIKSEKITFADITVNHFTSHYVPIKSDTTHRTNVELGQSLHPIMFLLNPVHLLLYYEYRTLHPIMFLLNLFCRMP